MLKNAGLRLGEDELREVGEILMKLRSSDIAEKLYRELQTNFANMAISLRDSVLRVVNEIEKGFKNVMRMYVVAFYLGVVLILLSGISGVYLREDLLAITFGGLGIADIVGYFVYRPAEYLQVSRGNLAQLHMAFINWIGDAHNWSEVFRKTFNGAKSDDDLISKTSKISEAMLANVRETMKAIDDYCEPKPPRAQ